MLEVVAEDRDESLAPEPIDDVGEICVGLLRRTRLNNVIKAKRNWLHPVGVEPRHLLAQAMRDIGTDGRDAVDRQRDLALQAAIGRPCLGRPVVARDVVGDEIEIGRDDASAEGTCLGDAASSIDLVRVPDHVGLRRRGFTGVDLDLRVLDEMLCVGGQFGQADEGDDVDAVIASHRAHRCGREHLRPGLVRPEPGDVDRHREIARLERLGVSGREPRAARIVSLDLVHRRRSRDRYRLRNVAMRGEPPVVP